MMDEMLSPAAGTALKTVGIVVGIVVLLVIVFTVMFILLTNKKRKKK